MKKKLEIKLDENFWDKINPLRVSIASWKPKDDFIVVANLVDDKKEFFLWLDKQEPIKYSIEDQVLLYIGDNNIYIKIKDAHITLQSNIIDFKERKCI